MARHRKRNGGRKFFALLKSKETEKLTVVKIQGKRSRKYAEARVDAFAGEELNVLLVFARGSGYFPRGEYDLLYKLEEMMKNNQFVCI